MEQYCIIYNNLREMQKELVLLCVKEWMVLMLQIYLM